eukprot:jgi/Psemu1/50783/gm1.50783_g
MKIAVIGGGITGAVVASELAKVLEYDDKNSSSSSSSSNSRTNREDGSSNSSSSSSSHSVVVFDQGRRGPGGRASHRAVSMSPNSEEEGESESQYQSEMNRRWKFEVLTNDDDIDPSALHFDHGCQFFRADTPSMKELVEHWKSEGWVTEWKARFGSLPETTRSSDSSLPDDDGNGIGIDIGIGNRDETETNHNCNPTDFFGIPSVSRNRNGSGSCSGSDASEDDNSRAHDAATTNPVYIGIGGMHLLPRRILESSSPVVKVHRGTRVSGVAKRKRRSRENENVSSFVWDVTTTVGTAAFHDTSESKAAEELARAVTSEASASGGEDPNTNTNTNTNPKDNDNDNDNDIDATTTRIVVHRGFDAVIFTDISSSSEPWHRASAGGIPESFRSLLPTKLRMPLFSCMIALRTPVRHLLPFDAFVAASASSAASSSSLSLSLPHEYSPLWFAACSQSKPGIPTVPMPTGPVECWTLVSTPLFAVDEIRDTTMRDPVTGAFRPQEDDYLNSGPGPKLRDAFLELVRPYRRRESPGGSNNDNDNDNDNDSDNDNDNEDESVLYLQAQRWGSGLPIDPERAALPPEDICGTSYVARVKGSLVYDKGDGNSNSNSNSNNSNNFVADDDQGLYYAGDFCSHFNPGMEAAALSGRDLAKHILARRLRRLKE